MNAASAAVLQVLSFGYRDRGGPLQQVRATVAVAWCVTLGLLVALFQNPVVLTGILLATLLVAWRCLVLREVAFAILISAPVGLVMAMINPIVAQDGVTVLVAGLWLPLIGTFDITQEALIYGLVLGYRALIIFAICALYVATVDPDQLLRVLRRFSVRSAITASLAVRFVPVLARDGANMAMARECRPGEPPGAATFVRSAFARSLDRASDSALALETRGYALARPMRVEQQRRRRADFVVIASAVLLAALAVAGSALGLARFAGYPLTLIESGGGDFAFAAVVALAASLPAWVPRKAPRR